VNARVGICIVFVVGGALNGEEKNEGISSCGWLTGALKKGDVEGRGVENREDCPNCGNGDVTGGCVGGNTREGKVLELVVVF